MMRLFVSLIVPLLLLLLQLRLILADSYDRADFPADFVFGSGTSAAQYEGAAFEDGRTPSIWDTFAHSGHTGGAYGDVSCDGYHKYKEDIKLMVDTGLEAFRFSISWSRLIPNGRGAINPKGMKYYNDLINELVKNGIQPHGTITHVDLPQVLQDEYGGWISRAIVKDFVEYADVCFREFGDRVQYWTTINEANIAALGGYDQGFIAPGRCSDRTRCPQGNGSIEPYQVVHNMLLAHASTAKLYRDKYKATQNGEIGLNVYTNGFFPSTNSASDALAAQIATEFYLGWVMNPLTFGDYPDIIKRRAKTRIPAFTEYESELVKGSADFIGVNHYFSFFVKDNPNMVADVVDYFSDMAVEMTVKWGDAPSEYAVMPSGLKQVLEYIKDVHGNPPVYIHENGQMTRRNGTLNDTSRVEYVQAYIGTVLDAVRNGSNTKGYFLWTLLDCLELLDGYRISFGMYYVDLDDENLTRYPKFSAHWYSNFLRNNMIASRKNNGIYSQVLSDN